MQFIPHRLFSLIFCSLCLVAVANICHLRTTGLGAQSRLGLIALAGALSMGVLSGLLAVSSNRFWQTRSDAIRRWLHHFPDVESAMSQRMASGLILCSCVSFLMIATHLAPRQVLENNSDQFAYLTTAAEIHTTGGSVALVRNLLTGQFEEANRHPLYLALLALWPTKEWGQWLSVLFGLMTLCGLGWAVMRQFGPGTSAVSCTLFATNFACCYAATLVSCESLMVCLATVGWLYFGRPYQSDLTSIRSLSVRQVCCGGWLGLMYLTKGTGLLWLVGYGILLVVRVCLTNPNATEPMRVGLNKASFRWRRALLSLACVCLGWGLVSAPLLIRNTLRYGSPTYNVNSWLLFVDELSDPVSLANSMSLGTATQRFLEEHSATQILERGVSGVVWELFILMRSLGPSPLQDSRILFGGLWAGIALFGGATERRTEPFLIPIWLLICVPVFGWYVPVAAGERFILPLVPPILVIASGGIVRLAQSWWPRSVSIVLTSGCLTWLIASTAMTLRLTQLD